MLVKNSNMSVRRKRKPRLVVQLLFGLFAGLLIGISALIIFLVQDRVRAPEAVDSGHFRVEGVTEFDGAIRIGKTIIVPDLALITQDGDKTSLRDLGGRFTLLTFGFTNCPDICPLTLSDFQQVHNLLGDQSEQVSFVFISVDGSRDSPAVLRNYFKRRELDGITALTGAEETVRRFGAPLGLWFEVTGDASTGAYSVNHTVGSFLLDADSGRWMMRFQFGLSPDQIAAELRKLLQEFG